MGDVVNRVNIHALAKGSTWGTVPSFGTNNGFFPQSISGLHLTRSNTPDKGAGMGFVQSSHQGPDQPVVPSFQILPYEACQIALMIMAMIMGADTVTGSADPYEHKMEAQDQSNYFVGMGWEEDSSEIKLLPSAIIEALEISADSEGRIVFDVTLKGNTIDDGTGSELSSVTYKEISGVFTFQKMVLRINAQGGAALASGDVVDISDFRIRMYRPSDGPIVSGKNYILQPKQGGFPEFNLEFSLPRRNAAAEALYDALKAGILQKADIVFSGSNSNRELKLEFPQAKLLSVDSPRDEIITSKATAQLQKAATTPTGMTSGILAPTATWKTDVDTSPLA